eukprot:CAMPEP_0171626118 /NCGR_PEP_ID=MMETSP0990-20121206/19827_1 /TAXON_ID=483369 /ORGANISM="non described non described, Strain CCMP2098" /LENGTH=321 /DNA_ID=CAMNT_0012193403 /DNA_START=85 /DNA_END=1050 /DNA_ORIENTATION=-
MASFLISLALLGRSLAFVFPRQRALTPLTVSRARTTEEIMAGPRSGTEICPPSGESLEMIAKQWANCAGAGIALASQNNTFYREETYEVKVQREGGLGLVLAELWSMDDGSGRGLVLVEEIVDGSNAAKAIGIEIGDTILGVSGKDGLRSGVSTQGMDWDTTVGALTGIEGPELTLVMQRLVKRGRIDVQVTGSQGQDLGTFNCASGSNLRTEFLRRSLPKDEIYDPFTNRFDAIGNAGTNCGGEGSCGTCLVAVTEGFDLCNLPGRVEGKALVKQGRPVRWRWSCRTVLGDGALGGNIKIQLQPQRAFADEQTKTEGLGV